MRLPHLTSKLRTHPNHKSLTHNLRLPRSALRVAILLVFLFIFIQLIQFTSINITDISLHLRQFDALQRSIWPSLPHLCESHNAELTSTPTIQLQQPHPDLPSGLKDYVAFHRKQRKCFLDPNCKNPRLLVWSCPPHNNNECAGLGDRLRGMQFALFLAIVSKRLLLISWSQDPYPLQIALAPSLIDWTIPDTYNVSALPHLYWNICPDKSCEKIGRNMDPEFLSPPDLKGHYINLLEDDVVKRLYSYQELSISTRERFSIQKAFGENPHISSIPPTIYPPEATDIVIQRIFLHVLFRSSDRLLSPFCQLQIAKATKYYGVHIRAGMDVNEALDRRFEPMSQHPQETVDHLLKCMKEAGWQKYPIFVASDSGVIREMLVNSGKQHNLEMYTWEQPKAVHIGLWRRDDEETPGETQYLSVFADLILLSGADEILMTGSGFAKRAMTLGTAKKLYIMGPNNTETGSRCTVLRTG